MKVSIAGTGLVGVIAACAAAVRSAGRKMVLVSKSEQRSRTRKQP